MGIGFICHDKDLLDMALKLQNWMLLSQQIVEEVDSRTARTIQNGKWLLVVFIIVVASLLHVVFVSVLLLLPLRSYAGMCFVVGFTEFTARWISELGPTDSEAI